MRTEAEFSSYIQRRLLARGINARLEGNISDIEIINVLKTASKNFTGGAGYPDIIALVKDFVLIMENKSDYLKLERKDGTNFSDDGDAVKNYAVNGAIFYARKILAGTHYTKIFAFGNAGDEKKHNFKPVFIIDDKKVKELAPVETFVDFTAENIENYYKQAVLGEELPETKELKKVIKYAGTLHEYLRNYGQLGETEKPLVVSAIILAMDDGLTLDELRGNTDETFSDGAIIFNHIVNRLNTAQIKPEIKKERVLAQFQLIKNRPLLNSVNDKLNKTPLKFFAQYIQDNVYEKVKSAGKDYLGIFYREFVSYSGGDGQTLGVVLTPPHITDLFCDLVNLNVNDVVLDPCCGTGGFLLAAMNRMLSFTDKENLRDEIKSKQLHGVEVRDDMFSIATTSMILRGDGKSNLICDDFFAKTAANFGAKFTVGFMNPPYSQAKNDATKHLSELRFIEHLLNMMTPGGRVAVIVPVSAMIGKTKDDKILKREILKHHTLKGVISLNKNTFYQIGTVPCIAVFEAGRPHKKNFKVKFINFEDDGFELRKHEGYIETWRYTERREYLLNCWNDNISDYSSNFMVETNIDADDEWLHSFYYYNDEKPAEIDFLNTIADYLTFEFNMITHGRAYLFDGLKKNSNITEQVPPLENKIWKEFFIEDVAEISSGKDIITHDQTTGEIPYISSSAMNNGIYNFISNVNETLESDCISVNRTGSVGYAFYHPYAALYSNNCRKLRPKIKNKYTSLFIVNQIIAQREKYSYGYIMGTERLKRQKILLPVNDAGEPDYEYMEKYIALREAKLIQQYLERISPPNVSEIPPLNEKIWKPFFIEDIFEIKPGKRLTKDKMTAGETPFIGASDSNNGITQFVGNENISADENVLGVNYNGSVVENFYHPYRCIFSDDVKRFKLKTYDGNQFTYLFLKTIILQQKIKYTYGYKFNESRMKKQKIMLPVNSAGEPDFEYMEAYSRNLFAQVIKRYLER